MASRRARVKGADPASVLRWTQWLLAQGKGAARAARAESRVLGLTKTAIARELGVSPRAITHWLADRSSGDFRAIPKAFAARLSDIVNERREVLQIRRERIDEIDEITQYRPKNLPLPIRQFRYQRPQFLGKGNVERSEIFVIDVAGLSYVEIFDLLRYYWYKLRTDGRKWDIRFLVKIDVEEYFQDEFEKDSIHNSFAHRRTAFIWVPRDRVHRHFIYPNARWEMVRASIEHHLQGAKYGERIREIISVAFIPYKPESKKAKARKRATGR